MHRGLEETQNKRREVTRRRVPASQLLPVVKGIIADSFARRDDSEAIAREMGLSRLDVCDTVSGSHERRLRRIEVRLGIMRDGFGARIGPSSERVAVPANRRAA